MEADPTAYARAHARVDNLEAAIPPACYTRTGEASNPCWVCHTEGVSPFSRDDSDLQQSYEFSSFARTNRWSSLFVDRSASIAAIADDSVLAYVRQDNYSALRESLEKLSSYRGFVPDIDLDSGFDDEGFALDGSGWRALRYLPFPGTFWPTNGSTDDVFVRLPPIFGQDARGVEDRAVLRANFALLEAAIASRPSRGDGELMRSVEPIDEGEIGIDLDQDGRTQTLVETLNRLPREFVGAASHVTVERYVFPEGTELLHSVRYLDPDEGSFQARRMKELRYMKKVERLDRWAAQRAIEHELQEKTEGRTPVYRGDALTGLRNESGWLFQGFIEDAEGRLRLQSNEEHRVCMGCHGALGVTIDATFSFARKAPGLDGFRPQDLRGFQDAPQDGHREGEVLTYFRRVGGGDEMRQNAELSTRYFPSGALDEAAIKRARPGGDRVLADLLLPSRERALALDKAYWSLVQEQRFEQGRDVALTPPANVHRVAPAEPAARQLFLDGRLTPAW